MDHAPPEKANPAEAAGWTARMNGERDMPPKEFQRDRDTFNSWVRGWDMADGRLKCAAWKK